MASFFVLAHLQHRVSHILQLLVGELGVYRQCHHMVAEIFAYREVAFLVTWIGVGFLHVQCHWIINGSCYAFRLQMLHHLGTV